MKYYQIEVSSEPKVIGVNNGVYQLQINNSKIEQIDSFKEFRAFFKSSNREFWNNQFKVKDFEIPVIEGKLLKKAKLTDIMGYAEEIPFLYDVFSEKFIETIEASGFKNHTKFEVDIHDVKERYYLLFLETVLLENFNFQESILLTGYNMTKNREEYKVDNFDGYRELKKRLPLARFGKISIPKKYLEQAIINTQGSYPFYSEKLIESLLSNGITGLEIKYNNSIELHFI